MTSIDELGEQEKIKAQEIIAATPAFEGIESTSIELGDDHTGDPSMWIIFHLRPGFEGDRPWIERFSDYSTKLGLKLLDSGLTRFPYTRIKPAA